MTAPAAAELTLSELHVYPVKSLAGISLQAAAAGLRGLAHDRRFLLLDARGVFLTQRQWPRMALVQPELDGDALVLRHTRRSLEPLRLSLAPPAVAASEVRQVRVWDDAVDAVPVGAEADRWLREALGLDCSLLALPRVDGEEGRRFAAGPLGKYRARAAFADGYPYLIAGQASLDELNARIAAGGERPGGAPLVMRRFRPNLVVTGATPFAEDGWRRIVAGAVTFALVKPCERCAITTVDPDAGTFGKEPLRTLARFRRTAGGGVAFAQNAVAESTGTLRVGDPVRVTESAAVAKWGAGEGAHDERAVAPATG